MIARPQRTTWWLAAGALALFALLLVAVVSQAGVVLRPDRAAVVSLHRVALAHPWWTTTMRTVSRVGAPATWWVILVAVSVILARRRMWGHTGRLLACAVGSTVLNWLTKAAVQRPRPALEHPVATAAGWSFPSGHAQAATVACLVLAMLLGPYLPARRRPLAYAVAALTAALVAVSRVALGVHFPSDVIAGSALGAAWVFLVSAAWNIPRSRRRVRRRSRCDRAWRPSGR